MGHKFYAVPKRKQLQVACLETANACSHHSPATRKAAFVATLCHDKIGVGLLVFFNLIILNNNKTKKNTLMWPCNTGEDQIRLCFEHLRFPKRFGHFCLSWPLLVNVGSFLSVVKVKGKLLLSWQDPASGPWRRGCLWLLFRCHLKLDAVLSAIPD